MSDVPSIAASHTLVRYGWLSLATGVTTLVLKVLGAALSGSAGVLSDALESVVNVAAAAMAIFFLRWAAQPADDDHPYGHGKGEQVAAASEGVLVFLAGAGIIVVAVDRFLHPRPPERIDLGAVMTGVATVMNGVVGAFLVRIGRRHHSEPLESDGQHLLTDVWTSVGVLVGLGLVALTGWSVLDPLIAIGVAGWVLVTGVRIVRRASRGILDAHLPTEELTRVRAVLDTYRARGVGFHALRTRRGGRRAFLSVHVLVPGAWTVKDGHDLCEEIERRLEGLFPQATADTHLEPVEDALSLADEGLDRVH